MKTRISVTATSEDSNLFSYQIKRDDKDVIWQDLTEEERLAVVNLLYDGFKFFGHFVAKELFGYKKELTKANKQNNE